MAFSDKPKVMVYAAALRAARRTEQRVLSSDKNET